MRQKYGKHQTPNGNSKVLEIISLDNDGIKNQL